jgi:hypothetical protein
VTADEYVNKIVDKYQVDTGDHSSIRKTAMAFKGLGEKWASGCLRSVGISGSFAKLTAVSSSLAGGSDIDLFISLTPNCNGTMTELYESLYAFLTGKNFTVKRQNVSLGIKVGNVALISCPADTKVAPTRTTLSTSAAAIPTSCVRTQTMGILVDTADLTVTVR